jgi:hypothetical protein
MTDWRPSYSDRAGCTVFCGVHSIRLGPTLACASGNVATDTTDQGPRQH